MRKFLQTTVIAVSFAGIGAYSFAAEAINPAVLDSLSDKAFEGEPDMHFSEDRVTLLNVGIARLDGTRLIAAPFGELEDWHFLDKRTDTKFTPITAAAYLKSVPEVAYGNQDSDNKLDEIRITAADSGMDYIVVYTVGRDADWADLGGAALRESEFDAPFSSAVYRNAEAKAVIMDTYNGTIHGAIKMDDAEFGVGELTDQIQDLIESLDVSTLPKV